MDAAEEEDSDAYEREANKMPLKAKVKEGTGNDRRSSNLRRELSV